MGKAPCQSRQGQRAAPEGAQEHAGGMGRTRQQHLTRDAARNAAHPAHTHTHAAPPSFRACLYTTLGEFLPVSSTPAIYPQDEGKGQLWWTLGQHRRVRPGASNEGPTPLRPWEWVRSCGVQHPHFSAVPGMLFLTHRSPRLHPRVGYNPTVSPSAVHAIHCARKEGREEHQGLAERHGTLRPHTAPVLLCPPPRLAWTAHKTHLPCLTTPSSTLAWPRGEAMTVPADPWPLSLPPPCCPVCVPAMSTGSILPQDNMTWRSSGRVDAGTQQVKSTHRAGIQQPLPGLNSLVKALFVFKEHLLLFS